MDALDVTMFEFGLRYNVTRIPFISMYIDLHTLILIVITIVLIECRIYTIINYRRGGKQKIKWHGD